jgi:hypothetical protein
MFKKSTLIVVMLAFCLLRANSQHLSHQVMVPAAGVIAINGVNYSQTIGETAVEIISAYDRTLTQGFQQPRMIRDDTLIPPEGTGVKVYPNPVSEYVKIELFGESARELSIMIININGTIVYSDQINFSSYYWHIEEVPVSSFIRGLYFVRVTSRDGIINRTFKIDKM